MTSFYSALLSTILLLTPYLTNGQADYDPVVVITSCKPLSYRKNLTRNASRIQVDSIAPLVKGRWYSGAMESVVKPGKRVNSIELQFNRQWRGVLFEDGKRIATFQLQVKRGHSDFTYRISYSSRALYHFPIVGYLQVCNPHLVLFTESEEDVFIFERVKKL